MGDLRGTGEHRPVPGAAVGGWGAIGAGACWLGKSSWILLTEVQPPLLFEVAPLLMAQAVLALGRRLPTSRARSLCLGLAVTAAAAALPVLIGASTPLPEILTGGGMALAQLSVVAGLAVAGVQLRRHGPAVLPLALAVATLPAVLLGGLLSAVLGERALEVPLVALGVAWVALGVQLLRGRYAPPTAQRSGRPGAAPRAAAAAVAPSRAVGGATGRSPAGPGGGSVTAGASRRAPRIAGTAAVLGGVGWLVVAVAAELYRRDILSYDSFNRFLAGPLLCFTVALALAPLVVPVRRLGRVGLAVATAGAALLFAGNAAEFYAVLLQDEKNAYAAWQAGEQEHWIGSEIGWLMFSTGMLVLLVGGIVTAVAVHLDAAGPGWLVVFTSTLGVGVVLGLLFGLSSAFVSVPVLALYGVGWVAFGRLIHRNRDALPGSADPRVPAPAARDGV